MSHEALSYEVILDRMIRRVQSRHPNLDVREGSVIFNALAPAALELAMLYFENVNVGNESFVNTASRQYLLEACRQMGMDVSQFNASNGVHKGEFNVEVPVGSRWNCDLYNYTVSELIGLNERTNYYEYRMTCETNGTAPNAHVGDLSAITDVPNGLTHAALTECLIEGEDESTDDEIRSEYFIYVNNSDSDGNADQYARWCSEYDGIGSYKIFPLWNGANTVKVSILSSSNKAASDELVAEFQEYLDPGSNGMGDGVAPIGAIVTVTTAEEKAISVTAKVVMKSGYSDTSTIDTSVTDYLQEVAYNKSTVSYMSLGAVILNAVGVDSISELLINNDTKDITLGEEEIPVLGTTRWTVTN